MTEIHKRKHQSFYYKNCWYCEHADPNGRPCSKSLEITVAIWKRDLGDIAAWDGPGGGLPRDRKAKGCPGFELAKICIKEDRDICGNRLDMREMSE